jgi:NhaA family Na+:H+ antiporter
MAGKKKKTLPEAETPVEKFKRPFQTFARVESSGGIILMLCAIVALLWANSSFAASYFDLWHTKIGGRLGDWLTLEKSLLHWINDALMGIFFFLVGLEIKREILVGELSTVRKAALSIFAAIGGMIVPALIYAGMNWGKENMRGWGIPMATDIAFALGVLALLGKRIPLSLKVFLTALAIVDDLGAILVIALFYTENVATVYFVLGGLALAFMWLSNLMGVRSPFIYFLMGGVLWFCLLKSGVHATLAGVLGAMTIPVRTRIDPDAFADEVRDSIRQFEVSGGYAKSGSVVLNEDQHAAVEWIRIRCEHVEAPLQRLEHMLLPWVAFLIMPVFALANGGVQFGSNVSAEATNMVALGIACGLIIGKPLGITLFAWLAVKLRFADLPEDVSWRQVLGAGMLGGIGFTMALFIGSLAFGDSELLNTAKIGILGGSLISGIGGFLLLMSRKPHAVNK